MDFFIADTSGESSIISCLLLFLSGEFSEMKLDFKFLESLFSSLISSAPGPTSILEASGLVSTGPF
jgi:hypothetical protein